MPVIEIPDTVSEPPPGLLMVKLVGVEFVPTAVESKVVVAGEIAAEPTVPDCPPRTGQT